MRHSGLHALDSHLPTRLPVKPRRTGGEGRRRPRLLRGGEPWTSLPSCFRGQGEGLLWVGALVVGGGVGAQVWGREDALHDFLLTWMALGLAFASTLQAFPLLRARRKEGLLGLGAALAGVALMRGQGWGEWGGMGCLLYALWTSAQERSRPRWSRLLLAWGLWCLWGYAERWSPLPDRLLQQGASLYSLLFEKVLGPGGLGPSPLGVEAVLWLGTVEGVALLRGERRFWGRGLLSLGLAASLPLWVFGLAWGAAELGGSWEEAGVRMLLSHRWLVPVVLGAIAWLNDGRGEGREEQNPRKHRGWSWAAAVLGIGGMVGMSLPWPRAQAFPWVVLWRRESRLADWRRPSPDQFGPYSGGMYGMLGPYLRALGFRAEMKDSSWEPPLRPRRAQAILIITPSQGFSPQECQRLRAFVRQGGGVLLLADHTDAGGSRGPLNALLKDWGIQVGFDTAWFRRFAFQGELRSPCCGFALSEDARRLTFIVAGASLEVRGPAFPIYIGRYGWSDRGDETNEEKAFIGNSRWDFGERMGDVVLVAGVREGKGKVVVFGDTSPFQNATLPYTYDLVRRVLVWLTAEEVPSGPWGDRAKGMGLGALGVAALLLTTTLPARLLASWGVALSLSVAAVGAGLEGLRAHALRPYPVGRGRPLEFPRIAWIDSAHLNRYSIKGDSPDALWGLFYNLMRASFLPLVGDPERDGGFLLLGDMRILITPVAPFSRKEVGRLLAFVEQGGSLIATTGWEDREGLSALLRALGLEVSNTPLGNMPARGLKGEEVFLASGWGLKAFPSSGPARLWLLEVEGVPVAARVAWGRGQVVVIADPAFLLNRNLESRSGYLPPNLRWLRSLLTSLGTP